LRTSCLVSVIKPALLLLLFAIAFALFFFAMFFPYRRV
jgi:hypothetical protein